MTKTITKGKIGNAFTSTANDHVVAVTNDIYDENIDKYQSQINEEVDKSVFVEVYDPEEEVSQPEFINVEDANYTYNWKTTDTPASDGKTEGNLKDLYQNTINHDEKLSELEDNVMPISGYRTIRLPITNTGNHSSNADKVSILIKKGVYQMRLTRGSTQNAGSFSLFAWYDDDSKTEIIANKKIDHGYETINVEQNIIGLSVYLPAESNISTGNMELLLLSTSLISDADRNASLNIFNAVGLISSGLFEFGNINIKDTGWIYGYRTTRVRTKEGITLHLNPGDSIKLSDYTDARFFVGFRKADGTYGSSNDWVTSDVFYVEEEGDYVLSLCNKTEKEIIDMNELVSLLDVDKKNNYSNTLKKVNETMNFVNDSLKLDIHTSKSISIGAAGSVCNLKMVDKIDYQCSIIDIKGVNKVKVRLCTQNVNYPPYAFLKDGNIVISKSNWGYFDQDVVVPKDAVLMIVHNQVSSGAEMLVRKIDPTPIGLDARITEIEDILYSGNNVTNNFLISHLFIDKIDNNSVVTIPNQSVFDIRIAARLGFDYIEANIQKTSDGRYFCMHGNYGKIGWQLIEQGGNDIKDVKFSDITYDTLRSYKYRSKFEKYQIPVSSLEEFCYECKRCGIGILFRDGSSHDNAALAIAESILGRENIIVSRDIIGRKGWKGMLMEWGRTTDTVDDIIAKCQSIKPPYCYMMNSNSQLINMSDSELIVLKDAVHNLGCYITIGSSYSSEAVWQKHCRLGFDMCTSTKYNLKPFFDGNICNVVSDIDFSLFSTNGSIVNNCLILDDSQTVSYNANLDKIPFLSKSCLSIRIIGTFNIIMGNYIHEDITENGTTTATFTTYHIEQKPSFVIKAKGQCKILSIEYHSSIS